MNNNKTNKEFYLIDIDGCITGGKNKDINLDDFIKLKIQLEKIKNYCLCTGRPAVYVESFSQFLSLDTWCICENGAYIYNTKTDEIVIDQLITENYLSELLTFKSRVSELEGIGSFKFELGKELSLSLNPTSSDIKSLFKKITESPSLDLSSFNVDHSSTAVDITPKNVTKKSGFKAIKKIFQLENFGKIIGIGDSSGDIPFLEMCDYIGCPSNSSDEVKKIATYISQKPTTKGVCDILDYFSHT